MTLPIETPVRRPASASNIFPLRQVMWRFKEVEDAPRLLTKDLSVKSPEDIHTKFRFLFDGLTTERFVVFILDSKLNVQAIEIAGEGTLNSCLVHPREVYRAAVAGLGASIMVAHNHPSGNPEPSREDFEITKQLVEAGKILGIPLHDHIVFGHDSYVSLAERGAIV